MDFNDRIEQLRPAMTAALKTLVNIKSVEDAPVPGAPYGEGVADCLEAALALCSALGFRTHNMDGHLGWAEYGDGPEMMAILGHLDVVPEGDGWTVCPPYEAAELDGKLYGRGTLDDKGPIIAALFALRALADEGFAPRRRIRVILGCNEETGCSDMAYYHAHGGEIPVTGFTPDGEYPLINGEKGVCDVTFEKKLRQEGAWRLTDFTGGTAPNVVPAHAAAEIACPPDAVLPAVEAGEKIRITSIKNGVRIEAEGVSAHGSRPELGENAIGRLCLYLKKLPFGQDTLCALTFLADQIGMDTTGSAFGINLKDTLSGALSFNPGMIRCRKDGDGVSALLYTVNYRWPVTFRYEDCGPRLNGAFAAAGWTVAEEQIDQALYQPADSELVTRLLAVYRAATGDDSPAKCIGGGTYAKSMPNILAFGPVFPGDPAPEHEANEFIDLDRMVLSAKIYAAAIRTLAE